MIMTTIPLAITARDEERALGRCLDSLLLAVAVAESRLGVTIAMTVVLDDCRDGTAAVAASRGVRTVASQGGKVEAQRTAIASAPDAAFHVFSDADIVVEPDTLAALCEAMLDDPAIRVAFPHKQPLAPLRRSILANALHVYNGRRGFSSQRTWFSGKLFAIRGWSIPDASSIARRARDLAPSAFFDLGAPLRVDDIYLSRTIRRHHGTAALRETAGTVWFRAPETWRGMYRYYRRMRRERERLDLLFPSEPDAGDHRQPDRLAAASCSERHAWHVFQLALTGCKLAYRAERFGCDHLGLPPPDPWPAIVETKQL